jgi:hypothetical protein
MVHLSYSYHTLFIIDRSSFQNFEMLSHFHLVSVSSVPLERSPRDCTFYSHRWVLFRSERATAPAVETPLTHAFFFISHRYYLHKKYRVGVGRAPKRVKRLFIANKALSIAIAQKVEIYTFLPCKFTVEIHLCAPPSMSKRRFTLLQIRHYHTSSIPSYYFCSCLKSGLY